MIYLQYLLITLLLTPFLLAADFGLHVQANLWIRFNDTSDTPNNYDIRIFSRILLIIFSAFAFSALINFDVSPILTAILMMFPVSLLSFTIYNVAFPRSGAS